MSQTQLPPCFTIFSIIQFLVVLLACYKLVGLKFEPIVTAETILTEPCRFTVCDGTMHLELICFQYENVGAEIDKIRESFDLGYYTTHIVMNKVIFPNGTMPANWYNGQYGVRSITFDGCHLTYLNSNVFHSAPFLILAFLRIRNNVGELEMKFHTSAKLMDLHILNSQLKNIAANFIEAIKHSLMSVEIVYIPPNITLNYMFNGPGATVFERMGSLYLHGLDSNITRYLHADNFTLMPCLQWLDLIDFNIDRIHPRAFHKVGETLIKLNLTGNKLKYLGFEWFSSYFDAYVIFAKQFILADNPLECDCEYYAIQNFTVYIRAGRDMALGHLPSCRDLNDTQQCDGVQTISSEKLLLAESKVEMYAYPKVSINIISGYLIVRTAFTSKFRVLIVQQNTVEAKHLNCSTRKVLRGSDKVSCMLLRRPQNVQTFLQRSELTLFFVILTHPRKFVWPLHIQSVRFVIDDGDIAIGMIAVACLTGFLTAILLYVWHCHIAMNKMSETMSPTTGLNVEIMRRSYLDIDLLSNSYFSIVQPSHYDSIISNTNVSRTYDEIVNLYV